MKIKDFAIIKALCFYSLFFANVAIADDSNSFGVGIGSMYNGIGFSYGLKEETSFRYGSLGCISLSSSDSRGTELNCGIGFGFVTTNMISSNNNHGVGIHLGLTYNEHENLNEVEGFVSPQYVYFLKGISHSGFNVGANTWFGKRDGSSDSGVGVQAGYQF
jgi:hypothetical protein